MRRSKAGRVVGDLIEQKKPHIVFLTEGYPGMLDLHEATSDPDFGYGISTKRKVLIYSRSPWRDVATMEESVSPSGRYVSGVTDISGVDVTCVGVCVPWSRAHVSSGRRDRSPWQDHKEYLQTLSHHFKTNSSGPMILAGDFNQRIPRKGQPIEVFEQLSTTIPSSLTCVTGSESGHAHDLIDHVFVSEHFQVMDVRTISNRSVEGLLLSDHLGLSVKLELRRM